MDQAGHLGSAGPVLVGKTPGTDSLLGSQGGMQQHLGLQERAWEMTLAPNSRLVGSIRRAISAA